MLCLLLNGLMNARLKPRKLTERLSHECLRRGRELWAASAVSFRRAGVVAGADVVTAEVIDGDTTARVYARLDGEAWQADCSCPRGEDCEHIAALVFALTLADDRPGAERASPSEPSAARTGRPVSGERKPRQRMVYLLRLSEDGSELDVCPSRVVPAAAGGQLLATPYSLDRLSERRQPDYVGDDDLAILHHLADRMVATRGLVWYPLGPSSHELLTDLLATGRCHWQRIDGPRLSLGEPLTAAVEWQLLDSGSQRLVLRADEADSGDPAENLQLPLNPPWRLNPDSGRCRRLLPAHAPELVADLLDAGPIAPAELDDWIDRLAEAAPDLPRPRRLTRLDGSHGPARPQLLLRNAEVGRSRAFETVAAAELSFGYDRIRLDWNDEAASRLVDDHTVVEVERDRPFEEACVARLEAAGLVPLHAVQGRDYRPGEGGLWVARRADRSEAVWLSLQQKLNRWRAEGWQVELSDDFKLELLQPDDWYGDLFTSEAAGDSFELDLGVVVAGEKLSLLPALLDWLERTPESVLKLLLAGQTPNGQVTLAVDERRVVLVSMERLADTLRGLADFFDQAPTLKDGRLRLPRARLAELSVAGRHWAFGGDEALAELSRRLADFERIDPMPAPPGLNAQLRGYQQFGLGWLQFLREFGFGGILADDMGLGKTLQALAHIQAEKAAGRLDKPCLVVAPTSLMFNWRAEARRFAPDLKLVMLHGPERRGQFQWVDESDLVLTTYPLLARDRDWLKRHEWHLLILDEAQAIKNARTTASRCVRELNARHRLCLTGTPLENNLGELWSLFDFLMPGLLGSQTRFRRALQVPIERHGDEERRELLARRIRPFFLRRKKADVAPELPPKTEITRATGLTTGQQRLYERLRVALHDKVRRAVADQGVERSRLVVLDALLRLRQVCCDPRLIPDLDGAASIGSAKLALLMDLLPEMLAEGRRVLLFSQFVGMLKLIEAELVKAGIDYVKLTGQTRNREEVVNCFQEGKTSLFLISLKAGGVGLNLTAADTVIHYDPWWNPAVEDQATDRAHRIGQTRKVFVYRLLTEHTIEEKVHQLQQSKRGLVESLFGGGGASTLTAADLEGLFEPVG
ncbi:MAG: SNF2-related protein [Wenzhouxiangella sp.]